MTRNDFVTTDLPLATTLAYLGFKITKVEQTQYPKAAFSFSKNDQLDDIIKTFWRKEIKVEPIGFLSTQRELKAQIYATTQARRTRI